MMEEDVMDEDVLEEPLNRTNPRNTRGRFIRIPKELIVRLKYLFVSLTSSTHTNTHPESISITSSSEYYIISTAHYQGGGTYKQANSQQRMSILPNLPQPVGCMTHQERKVSME
jgi:hypothetical protein